MCPRFGVSADEAGDWHEVYRNANGRYPKAAIDTLYFLQKLFSVDISLLVRWFWHDDTDMPAKIRNQIKILAGPNGAIIYKMMLAKSKE